MNKIKEIRKIRGLSQKELAKMIDSTSVNISYLEISKRGLSQKWLDKLSKALNCTKAQLLGEQSIEQLGKPPKEIKENQRILLYTARTKKSLSINELAKKLGVPRSTIWAFENGKASISDELIKRIAEALNVSLESETKEESPPPSIQLVSDNPYPITENYLKYSMDIYSRVIGSNPHFEEEKAAFLYEIYKIVYDFFEKEHHQDNEISKLDLQGKAVKAVSDILKKKGKYE